MSAPARTTQSPGTVEAAAAAVPPAEWLLLPDLALPRTRWALVDLTREEWRRTGAYLRGLLEREPLHSSPHWAGMRILLGTLAAELDAMVEIAGDDPAAALALWDRRGEGELARWRADAEALARHGVALHGG